jgi:hypothetical protein
VLAGLIICAGYARTPKGLQPSPSRQANAIAIRAAGPGMASQCAQQRDTVIAPLAQTSYILFTILAYSSLEKALQVVVLKSPRMARVRSR